MIKQLKIFFTALTFYTRLPAPSWVGYSQNLFDRSTRYFPVIGWIVGGWGAMIFIAADTFLPKSISLLLSMAGTVLLTGAFHEDGFADCCDGFGAGWTKQQILEIMKDSRIGTYAAVGLFFMLLLKFQILSEVTERLLPLSLIVGHSFSRAAVLIFRQTHEYVRDQNDTKAKPMPQNISRKDGWIGMALGSLPLVLLPFPTILTVVILVLLTEFFFSRWIARRIGGYTGDCLGATQQLCELACYLGILVPWKFI